MIDFYKGDYESAGEKLGKAMKIVQQLGDPAGEAENWYAQAKIDLNKGDYEAAREKFETAMKIVQQIGDREGEASIFCQLGFLAWDLGIFQEGLCLVALACLMLSSIGHADARGSSEDLYGMAMGLRYTQQQLDSLMNEVVESYQKDRGQSLIDSAFPTG